MSIPQIEFTQFKIRK